MTPAVIESCGDILARYDVLLCDIWGVLHDGGNAFPAANDALTRFRAMGGTVVLVSNAPQPEHRVAELLDEKALARSAWDAIVTSGDIALRHIAEKAFGAVHHIGPMPRSAPFISRLPRLVASAAAADAIVVSGLVHDAHETAEDYRPLLEASLARGLPLICANPDLVVDLRGRHYPCAGVLGELYEAIGGPVYWAGKPRPAAYATALETAAKLRQSPVAAARVLAIGDSVRTDLAAASGAGVDALFITAGIHRHDVMADGAIVPARLAELLASAGQRATAAAPALRW